MRISLIIIFLFTIQNANATPGEFIGRSASGITFILDMDGAFRDPKPGTNVGTWKPDIYQYRGKKNYEKKLSSNCSIPGADSSDWKLMECIEDASTPLSKVEYKVIVKSAFDIKMECTKGCTALIPKLFRYKYAYEEGE